MSGLVVIGGSAGSLEVILYLLSGLRPGFDMPVIIVVHRGRDTDSTLLQVLSSRTTLDVKEAEDKALILPGTVYLVPADYHLLVEKDGTFSLDSSEKVKYSRPSIDVTFQTVARAFGPGCIAILLSGANDDGIDGVRDIASSGGRVVVQDPGEATVPFLPRAAIQAGVTGEVLSREDILRLLNAAG